MIQCCEERGPRRQRRRLVLHVWGALGNKWQVLNHACHEEYNKCDHVHEMSGKGNLTPRGALGQVGTCACH
eukprot:728704-Karenia_brevis.AAC.1